MSHMGWIHVRLCSEADWFERKQCFTRVAHLFDLLLVSPGRRGEAETLISDASGSIHHNGNASHNRSGADVTDAGRGDLGRTPSRNRRTNVDIAATGLKIRARISAHGGVVVAGNVVTERVNTGGRVNALSEIGRAHV